MQMDIDSQADIRQMEKEERSTGAKHIDVNLKFIKACAKRDIVNPCYVHNQDMAADLLTNAFNLFDYNN